MIKKLTNTIISQHLFTKDQEILVAVSGGIDSMVLLHSLHNEGYKCTAAHVNFQLRGIDSDKDEDLVKKFASDLKVPFVSTSFDTNLVAKERKISIEMAARELRYSWFAGICNQQHLDVVAVGHHQDDQVETFFMNLVRGSGLKGLSGIQLKNKNIVRPLLGISREDIHTYAIKNTIPWREDASNKDEQFKRNHFRQTLIPELKKHNPSLDDTIIRTINKMKEGTQIIARYVELWSGMYLKSGADIVSIPIMPLSQSDGPMTLLHELISPFGFNESQIENILLQMESNPGKFFYSKQKRLLIDRHELIISDYEELMDPILINKDLYTEHLPIKLSIETMTRNAKDEIPSTFNKVWFDADKVAFPLTLRRWKNGDQFRPIGMKGNKKLSDFFIDQKLSMLEKEQAFVLCSGEDIIWIVGYRMDDRVKVSNSTRQILKMQLD